MKNKKAFLPLLVVAAGALVAVLILGRREDVERQTQSTPPPLVRVVTVELEDVTLAVRGRGTAVPAAETTLVAQVPGRVERIGTGFADGGAFREGEVLVRIDPRDFELAVAQAEATVAQARVAVERERAEAEVARREWADLGLGDAAPLAAREPQLAQAEASLTAAEAQLQRARLDLERTTVRAPFDGRVRRKLADLGRYVTPGTPLAEILSTAYAEVPLPVSQQDLAHLEVDWSGRSADGPPVTLRTEVAGRQRTWRGRIVRVASEIDPQTRMMTLYARVDDPSRDAGEPVPLPIGSFLEADIEGRRVADAAVLPRAALRDGNRALVVDADGRLHFRSVEVVQVRGDDVVVGAGLGDGELVCVSPLEAPIDGMRVRTVAESPDVEAPL